LVDPPVLVFEPPVVPVPGLLLLLFEEPRHPAKTAVTSTNETKKIVGVARMATDRSMAEGPIKGLM
jgi:hypothetical protein